MTPDEATRGDLHSQRLGGNTGATIIYSASRPAARFLRR